MAIAYFFPDNFTSERYRKRFGKEKEQEQEDRVKSHEVNDINRSAEHQRREQQK